jgi:hypothetical protein
MAIQYLRDVPIEERAGKFTCCPRPGAEFPYGWPALITKATRGRITYRRLTRGEWDGTAEEWQVAPMVPGDTYAEMKLEAAMMSPPGHLMLVCDTSEEAISLYVQTQRAEKAIRDHRHAALSHIVDGAIAGTLERAAYLERP